MKHLEWHQHAFIDENNKVINIAVFDETAHNTELINNACITNGGIKAICCCTFGETMIGATWTGSKFIPVTPFESWIWNDELNVWEAPILQPEDGTYEWNEDTKSWNLIHLWTEIQEV
jgi:hypothetical protein